ncbi:probable inactive receptor kinase At2g26730 [Salvia miltiorrhiza]|uniref:probable inactive receptor kinase At2g26730 n=1 Tax=Salvia miltiorrhiza TaxID=226208 RepID=UPI0025AD19C4|nr:probable inactive receptor kinase At2g26730 [Salvia miltiorrhiza]
MHIPNLSSCLLLAVVLGTASCNAKEESAGGSSDLVAILVVANVIVLVVILFLLIIYYKKYTKLKRATKEHDMAPRDREHDSTILERKRSSPGGGGKGKLVFVGDGGEPEFNLDDLLRASAEGLGKGNFGSCYKAVMEIGQAVVVKRLLDLRPLSGEEFVRHVRAIAALNHPNLLPLLAYYHSKGEERLFLYRFATHGNLFNRLHGGRGTRERVLFRWSSRLAAARGVARALEHLHRHSRSEATAPHGNLKSSNVLLDENEEPLVCDYGLVPLAAPPVAAQRMVCYKTPEYQSRKSISKKSDVWSYGCLVFELLTGRIPAHSAPPGTNGVDLCGWVNRAVREEWTAEIFDPEIVVNRGANQSMLRLMQIAMKCCDKLPENRPEMAQVVAEVDKVGAAIDSEDEELAYSSPLTDDSYSLKTI